MKSLNSLIIEGNMVRQPVLKTTPNGTPLCTFSIAANRNFKKDDTFVQETSYFDVETWSNLAKLCNQNGSKGRGVRVVGRIKQDRWVGADGKNYSKVKVVAEHVEFKPVFKTSGNQLCKTADDRLCEAAACPSELKEEMPVEEEIIIF
ncbi:single-stranded DNA-binding protein [Treponema pedis]|uniref:Single-stranded DNA-binding protein n=1 Tax=Treponema pedis TaxID=409322 RepID=A0A7S6WQN2_9SPIR|nr:single-stranded DNA-binding protein [Treponema pedis]QOW60977.1 single-stranded DNA-binding protein [Treponema pedis]